MRCPYCNYYIITLKQNSMNFFHCENPKCKKISCTVCNKETIEVSEDYDEDEDEL